MIPQPTLRARLERFSIGSIDARLTFTQRVARENGWSLAYAERVEHEYKRFVYLAMTAGHPVTPSDEVDQCWHLHLTYTRSYWDEMCGEVLGRPLHHGPTAGGAAESRKYRDWYGKTLASYERAFGEPPPTDVWPAVERRFAARYRRIEVGRHVLVSHRAIAAAAAMASLLVLAACMDNTSGAGGFLGAVVGLVVIAVVAFVIAQVKNHGKSRPRGRRGAADHGDAGLHAGAMMMGSGGARRGPDDDDARKLHELGNGDDHGDAGADLGGGDSGCGGGGCGGGCGGD